jgi:riboflavin kinase/FMN adenylyltransferase
MDFVRGLRNLRQRHRHCVATIGNFDGIHLGHQAIIRQLLAVARGAALPAVVILFEPQPAEYFQPDRAPPRLTRWREKLEYLDTLGVDRVVCLVFNAALAELPARDFVARVLVERLGIRHIVVGDDFRFGKARAGDFALLWEMGLAHGFSLERAESITLIGERVSSTAVRLALARGDLAKARTLLGRDYSIGGRIVHGEKRGRSLGFATANVNLKRLRSPVHGIFAARVRGLQADTALPAVAYVGPRPAFGGSRDLLEVHIFDFAKDCYGRYVRVELIEKLRDDRHFDTVEALRQQIARDAMNARHLLMGTDNDHQASTEELVNGLQGNAEPA